MGCCCSSSQKFDVLGKRTLQELGLSSYEVKKLVELFRKIDVTGRGFIHSDQFFDFFDTQPSLVNMLIFSCYDLEKNGEMSLIQFICTLWSFFTVKPEDLGEFVFFIFDLKKTGEMPYSEVTNIVKQIHRRYYEESATLKPLVKKMVKGPGGSGGKPLTPNAFKIWSAANPDVCRPIVGKQRDMMDKACRRSFWNTLMRKREKVSRLKDVYHIYNFTKRIRGTDMFDNKKKLTKEEQALQDKKDAQSAKITAAAADKAKKIERYKKKTSTPILETSEGYEVSYFDVDDIDNIMDHFTVDLKEVKSSSKKGKSSSKKKKSKKSILPPIISKSSQKVACADSDFENMTRTKELPPLVLKALEKGQLSSAEIAPMDNCRISDAARAKVQRERALEKLSAEEKQLAFAKKASRMHKTMSSDKDIFH